MSLYPTTFPDLRQGEEIRQIEGFPDYLLTNTGKIWKRNSKTKKWRKPGFRRIPTQPGKLFINLRNGNKRTCRLAGVLFLTVFVGSKPEKYTCSFLDGDYTNLSLNNLVWSEKEYKKSEYTIFNPDFYPKNDTEFRRIQGYENYWVTDIGEIWSYAKKGKNLVWKNLNPIISRHKKTDRIASVQVTAYNEKGSNRLFIGPSVLTAFVGPCPEGMECCHWDGNPLNNHILNLRWDTHQGNMKDMVRHWTNCRKTSYDKVILILQIAKDYNLGRRNIAKIVTDIPAPTIGAILYHKCWKEFREQEHPKIHLKDLYKDRIKKILES